MNNHQRLHNIISESKELLNSIPELDDPILKIYIENLSFAISFDFDDIPDYIDTPILLQTYKIGYISSAYTSLIDLLESNRVAS